MEVSAEKEKMRWDQEFQTKEHPTCRAPGTGDWSSKGELREAELGCRTNRSQGCPLCGLALKRWKEEMAPCTQVGGIQVPTS